MITHAELHLTNTTRETPAYYARIAKMTDRAIREYRDWAWAQNLPTNEVTLTRWEAEQAGRNKRG